MEERVKWEWEIREMDGERTAEVLVGEEIKKREGDDVQIGEGTEERGVTRGCGEGEGRDENGEGNSGMGGFNVV